MIRCVMKDWLPLQPWRVCFIRHVAAKVRLFRGDESANPCLHCPQVTDLITEPNNITEVGTMNQKSERYGTCSDCETLDTFLFCKGRCRQCHFDHLAGKEPGATIRARRAAQAEKELKSKKRGKTKPEQTQSVAKKEGGIINVTSTQEPVQRTGCEHLIAFRPVVFHSVSSVIGGAPIYVGETIEHLKEDASDIQLFSFCPLCGKQLNLIKTTEPKSFLTVFREAENG